MLRTILASILLVLPSVARAAEIVVSVPAEAPEGLSLAAEDLRRCLGLMTGREAVISAEAGEEAMRAILGVDETLKGELGPEGYRIQSDGKTVTLTGSSDLGAQHAVYAFLERLGCRWFFPGHAWESVPKLAQLEFPAYEEADQPGYQMRRIWYGWGIRGIPQSSVDYRDWVRRNRMGGSLTGSTGHAYASIARPDLHFEEHPEWFPLIDGNRTAGGQLCISNPDIKERAVTRAKQYFRASPNIRMISMSPNDGARWCRCEHCAKLGSVTDQALWLANQVGDAIREEFPDKLVAMYGYAGTSAPPDIEAAPNVIIFIATAFNSVGFSKSLEGWSKKAKYLGIRDYYNVIIWNREMPRWQVDRMRKNIPYHHDKGAIGVSAESGNQWAAEGLNYYVAAKLMWDTKTDVDKLLDDFFAKCWGQAAAPMRRYYERFKGARMSSRMLGVCLSDLKEASEMAKAPEVVRRLDMMKLYLHWVRLFYEHNTAKGGDAAVAAARKALHFAWRIRTTNMVHSYAQFREMRIWRVSNRISKEVLARWRITDEPMDKPDQPEAGLTVPREGDADLEFEEDELDDTVYEKKKEPTRPPPMFTHAEIEALFQDDLKVCGEAIDVSAREYSLKLVPVPEDTPGVEQIEKPGVPRYRGSNSFLFSARGAGPYQLRVHPGFIRSGAGSFRLYVVDKSGDPVMEGKVEGSEAHELELKLPRPGIYRIQFSCGGMAARIDFGDKHGVWELKPGGRAHVIGGSGRQFFYVPKGTRAFAVGMATPDGGGAMTILDPEGEVRLQKSGNYAPGEEFAVAVPEGMDGAVWSFRIGRCEDAGSITLSGVPPYSSVRPDRLLVPKEVLGE